MSRLLEVVEIIEDDLNSREYMLDYESWDHLISLGEFTEEELEEVKDKYEIYFQLIPKEQSK